MFKRRGQKSRKAGANLRYHVGFPLVRLTSYKDVLVFPSENFLKGRICKQTYTERMQEMLDGMLRFLFPNFGSLGSSTSSSLLSVQHFSLDTYANFCLETQVLVKRELFRNLLVVLRRRITFEVVSVFSLSYFQTKLSELAGSGYMGNLLD